MGAPVLRAEETAPVSPPVWQADYGDGTYTNPILQADYSDPDAVRVGDDFWMTSSSFSCMPGLPVLHSKDLVNWRIVGHVFQNYPFDEFRLPQHGNGVWAPALRYHNGEFFVYFGDPDRGIFMAKTKNPAGPWGPLVAVWKGKGRIDPCPFWDYDGNAYLVHAWAKSRAGFNGVLTLARLSPDGTRLLDDGKIVFDGADKHPTIEGPKLYKRNGYYYIFAPAGGVKPGWQTVLRSKNIDGPYEDRIVLAQGNTSVNGPHQGAWVKLASGEDWFLHFQDRDAYGRIVHLQPMRWVDDWPVIGADPDGDGTGEPVATHKKPNVGRTYPVAAPQTSDDFSASELGLQWQWYANFDPSWITLGARPGWLRLSAVPLPEEARNLYDAPNLLLQKFPAPQFHFTTRLEFGQLARGDKAGLVVMGMDYAYLAVENTPSGHWLMRATCLKAHERGDEVFEEAVRAEGNKVFLRVEVAEGAVCRFGYSADGRQFTPIGKPFPAQPGRWIGAKVGLFCIAADANGGSSADFDWVEVGR
jgi:beta-xylosidase